MSAQERSLRLILRVIGSAALLAAPCVLMPYACMNAIHQDLGMGTLPEAPIVGYLARSTSAFYALLGGLLWIVSYDLLRHRRVLGYLGAAILLFGLLLLGVDLVEEMPLWWTLAEGPFNAGVGIAILYLSCRLKPSDDQGC